MLTFSVNSNIDKEIENTPIFDQRPSSDLGRQWWSEVVFKTLDKKTDDNVNLDAYGYSCERNDKMTTSKKEVALLTVEEIDSGLRGVADTVAFYLDRNVDSIIESDEARTLVHDFMQVHEDLLLEEGVNIWKVITLAKQANTMMIDKLRDLMSRYNLTELIQDVLRNRECMAVLEGVMKC